MSVYRRRLYSVEDIQLLMIQRKHLNELDHYSIKLLAEDISDDFIVDNVVDTANVVLLLAIDRYINNFIDVSFFNLTCDRIIVYIENCGLLGEMKVFNKIMDIVKELHYEPFVAQSQ